MTGERIGAARLDELGVVSEWKIAPQWQGRPSALQCLGLSRLVEEALSNVIKHARATVLKIVIHFGADQIDIIIEDNGIGIHQINQGSGIGISNLNSRADLLGAKVEFFEAQPHGTRVQIICPLISENLKH